MNIIRFLILSIFSVAAFNSCASPQKKNKQMENVQNTKPEAGATAHLDTATFGQGCFWCAEAIFSSLEGVISVTSGFSGGQRENPNYEQVCSGATGHAEVVQVVYDPTKITYDLLLKAFWSSHDPTTLNRQGNDVGTQYRSVIFYHTDEQKQQSEAMIRRLTDEKVFDKPIVTEVTAASEFYKAEDYHQNYYNDNPNK